MIVRNRVTQYYDKKRKEVLSGSKIIFLDHVQPSKHSDDYVYLGSWYVHEKWPYVAENGKVYRDYYKDQILIYNPE